MKSMAWLALVAVALGAQASEEDSTPCDNVETDAQNYACAAYNKQTAERELKSALTISSSALPTNTRTKTTRSSN